MASQTAARNQGTKLFGRAFYESIGSPKLILAPMVDHSEFAWRMLTRSFLPHESSKSFLAYTPMLHSRMFADTPKYRNHHFEPLRSSLPSPQEISGDQGHTSTSDYHLDGNPAFDRPLFVQFCSNSPEDLLEAAKIVEPFCDAVDLNLGCPQGIARKGHYGAFLQEDWGLISKLINILHKGLAIPVTAKMRILETKEKTLAYARMLTSAGASIITVHGRRREQKGHNTGLADWSVISYLRAHLPFEVVIFANGNILQHKDIEECLAATGADGVMSAEANLHDPTVFAPPPAFGEEGREYWRGADNNGGYRIDAVMRRYMDILYRHIIGVSPPLRPPLFIPSDYEARNEPIIAGKSANEVGETAPSNKRRQKNDAPINLRVVQSHLFHLLRPMLAKHTDIRDKLAKCRAGDVAALEEILQMVEDVTKQGLLKYEAAAGDEQDRDGARLDSARAVASQEVDESLSSEAAINRCRRPWWVCQAYVRPLPKEAIEKGAITLSQKDKARHEMDQAPLPVQPLVAHG